MVIALVALLSVADPQDTAARRCSAMTESPAFGLVQVSLQFNADGAARSGSYVWNPDGLRDEEASILSLHYSMGGDGQIGPLQNVSVRLESRAHPSATHMSLSLDRGPSITRPFSVVENQTYAADGRGRFRGNGFAHQFESGDRDFVGEVAKRAASTNSSVLSVELKDAGGAVVSSKAFQMSATVDRDDAVKAAFDRTFDAGLRGGTCRETSPERLASDR